MSRIIKSIQGVILVSASLHLAILLGYSLATLNPKVLNYFNILDFDLFFPSFVSSGLSDIFSVLIVVGLFVIFWKKNN
jgi:hypothetical protein